MEQEESCVQVHAIVRGQVQGVGYRMWAQQRARMLGISGYVRNLADGSVEVVADGARATLEQLLVILRRGPEDAAVRSIQSMWLACAGEFDRFEIRR